MIFAFGGVVKYRPTLQRYVNNSHFSHRRMPLVKCLVDYNHGAADQTMQQSRTASDQPIRVWACGIDTLLHQCRIKTLEALVHSEK